MDAQFTIRRRPLDPMSQAYAHSRSRTTSSNVLPDPIPPHVSRVPPELEQPSILGHGMGMAAVSHANRSPSVNTFSTVSSGMAPPAAYRTSPTNNDQVRRSTSSRSGGVNANAGASQTSYVALLRRQKATVWSERAQFEDPRLAAQQKAARIRAQREIVGNAGVYTSGGGRTSTGLSAGGKIRHHGTKGSTLGFGVDSNYVGIAGVPLRLSAAEVEAEDSDEDDLSAAARPTNHRRTGSSGRNSTASGGRRGTPMRTSTGALISSGSGLSLQSQANSNNNNNANRRYSPNEAAEAAGSFTDGDIVGGRDDAASGKARSTASGGSNAERGDQVPDLGGAAGRLPANSAAHAAITRERSVRNAEDLRRRGSVDERTMTMSAQRLFIANPD